MVLIFVVSELLAPERNVVNQVMPTIHSAASSGSGERSVGRTFWKLIYCNYPTNYQPSVIFFQWVSPFLVSDFLSLASYRINTYTDLNYTRQGESATFEPGLNWTIIWNFIPQASMMEKLKPADKEKGEHTYNGFWAIPGAIFGDLNKSINCFV